MSGAAERRILPWPQYHAQVLTRLRARNQTLAPDLDPAIRERLWRGGFLADKWTLFDLERRGCAGYLTDVQSAMARNINGRYGILLDDKLAAHRALLPFDQPELLLSIHSLAVTAWPAWRRALESARPAALFVKPTRGAKGIGVSRAELRAGAVHWRGEALAPVAFVERLRATRADHVVVLGARQHDAMAALNADSVNTVRTLVVRDPASGRPAVAVARLRVGVAATGAIDNFSSGGLAFPVDLATGIVGGGIQRQPAHRVRALEHHPDSGLRITGRALPLWDQVMAVSVDAMAALPFLDYIAWDIAIGPDRPSIIEGNSSSGVDVFQVHGPLLSNATLQAFYRHHGILDWGVPADRGARIVA
jgi:hypothetical protein